MNLGRARVTEFRLKYGEKADALIEAIKLAVKMNDNKEAGDFSYKQVVEALGKLGYNFDPRNLLRVMEREYGLLETSFRTANQHWWKVKVNELVETDDSVELENPRVMAVRIKGPAFLLHEIRERVEVWAKKSRVT